MRVDGDADASVANRIRIEFDKFGQFVPLHNGISLKVRARLYSSCV